MKPPLPLIALVLLAAVLVAPAAAVNILNLPDTTTTAYNEWTRYVDLNAYDPGGAVIAEITLIAPPDSITQFSLYDYGQEITGEINRTTTGTNAEAVTYRLGDQTAGPYERTTWLSIPALPDETFTIKYGVYDGGGRHLWMQPYMKGGSWDNLGYNITDIIYRVAVSSTQETRITIITAPIEDLNAAFVILEENTPGNLIAMLWGLLEGVYLAIALGWYMFKIVFIDNLLLFAGLFEAVGMCYAANKSRDIFQFIKKVVDYNAAAIRAMFWLIGQMVGLLTRIINALNPLG
ncbi:MAG: hypothetical protein WC343_13965 [Bacilli bacterium]|jgi:hypothetical protein